MDPYRYWIKPLADRLIALLLLVLLAPLLLLLILLLAIRQRGRVFFVQQRAGYRGRTFRLVKFKTMLDTRDEQGELLPDEQRITAIGRVLRRSSLDELPQLLNVVAGQLSLIGPRPLLPQYLPYYDRDQARRHDVRPGITGWAQVNGRNALNWPERFALDVWYVDHLSWKLDLYILWRTMRCVVKREGIDAVGGGTMPYFTGNH